MIENSQQEWAVRIKNCLLWAKELVAKAQLAGLSALPPDQLAQIEQTYQAIVVFGLEQNPLPPPDPAIPKRGKRAKSKARNLLERFATHQKVILAFAYDFSLPFDNNLAERDIRMMKVQQKISGCFRNVAASEDFCRLLDCHMWQKCLFLQFLPICGIKRPK